MSGKLSQFRHLVVLFLHDFRGISNSFDEFLDQLRHRFVDALAPDITVTTQIYNYRSRGSFTTVVDDFVKELPKLARGIESVGEGEPGSARFALCGHGIGGLIMADAMKELCQGDRLMFNRIVTCIGFDTPFLGYRSHTNAFDNRTAELMIAGSAIITGGALLSFGLPYLLTATPAAAAAAGAAGASSALLARRVMTTLAIGASTVSILWLYFTINTRASEDVAELLECLEFLSITFESNRRQRERLDELVDLDERCRISFANLYVNCPNANRRTFITVPPGRHLSSTRFVPIKNMIANTAKGAHKNMFNPELNDGFDMLIQDTASLILQGLENY